MDVHPGPHDPSVLREQQTHKSDAIWHRREHRELTSRHSGETVLRRAGPVDARVLQYIRAVGFYGVHTLDFIQFDWALINALVERWRVETHTFHLPVGETTITLQDVSIILGLPVDGLAVSGIDTTRSKEQWQALCQ